MVQRTKRRLRSRIRAEFAELSIDELTDASARITARLIATELWRRAGTILAFNSMPAEIQTSRLVSEAIAAGKRVALPRIVGRMLVFSEWSGGTHELTAGPLGIREPPAHAQTVELDASTLMVAPGLAFGRDGSRLGRAGGYYDRYLAADRRGAAVAGICLHRFLFDTLPTEDHDQFVQVVITENETVVCHVL